jgi:multiple sugar transport system substrate-binding protein
MAFASRLPDMIAIEGLRDITEWVEADGLMDIIPEERWESATVDGSIYAVPSFMFVDLVYYRADWLEEAGLEPPTTWEEFTEVAIALTDPEQDRYGFGLRGGGGGQGNFQKALEGFNGPIVDADGNPSLDREAAEAAIQWYTELFTVHGAVPASVTEDSFRQMIEGFQVGQTGMIWHHTGSLGEMQAIMDEGTFLTTAMPTGPAQFMGSSVPAFNAMVDPAPENEEAAWTWLKYWTEIDTQVKFMEKTGYFPSSTVAAEDTRVLENPLYAPLIDTVGVSPSPGFPGQGGWAGNTVLPVLQQTLLGDLTPAEAAETIVTELETTIEENM